MTDFQSRVTVTSKSKNLPVVSKIILNQEGCAYDLWKTRVWVRKFESRSRRRSCAGRSHEINWPANRVRI